MAKKKKKKAADSAKKKGKGKATGKGKGKGDVGDARRPTKVTAARKGEVSGKGKGKGDGGDAPRPAAPAEISPPTMAGRAVAARRRRRRLPRGPLKVALLGAGTALHAMFGPALRRLPDARLVAVMDPWEEARARAEADYGVTAYAELPPLLAAVKPHLAIVASPTYAHAEQVLALAEAGVHVFCEKPMARTLEECEAMIAACDGAGVRLGVGFMKRYNAALALASRLVAEGELGDLFEVDCEWSFPAGAPPERYGHPHQDWRGYIENLGGVFQDHGSHTLDLCRTWLGEVSTLSAQMRIVEPRLPVEDVAAVLCRHRGGGISTHRMNIRTHKPLMERYELFGSEGTLEVRWGGPWRWSAYTAEPMTVQLHRRGRERVDLTPRPEQSIELELGLHQHYLAELRAYVAALRAGEPTPVDGSAGRTVVELVTAAYQSAAEQKTVGLPLSPPYVDLEPIFSTGRFK